MKIRADTPDENQVPKVGDEFVVSKVEKQNVWWIIELERKETKKLSDED